MAKGTLNGLLKGKLGNSVFYKITNSNDKEKQGTRAYVASVANPKTAPQANQRMRMKPAINFYRGLADLLDHSWEGMKYGALSRQKFMQLALSPTTLGIPFVNKGESRFIPGEYPVSQGSVANSLAPLSFYNGANFTFNIGTTDELIDLTGATPWGTLSQILIDNSDSLRDGDEITFIAVVQIDNLFIPVHSYFVLDVSSTLTCGSVFNAAKMDIAAHTSNYLNVQLYRGGSLDNDNNYDGIPFDGQCVAAAIIVSRHPSRTSTTWLRSSSTMVVSEAFKAAWMSTDRYAAALATYQNSSTELTSDWLLNQAGSASGNAGSGGSGGLIQNFTLENVSVTPVGASAAEQLAYYNDGTNEGFICDSVTLVEPVSGSAYKLCAPAYKVNNKSVYSYSDQHLPTTAKVISLSEFPSIRTKIAQFYTLD